MELYAQGENQRLRNHLFCIPKKLQYGFHKKIIKLNGILLTNAM